VDEYAGDGEEQVPWFQSHLCLEVLSNNAAGVAAEAVLPDPHQAFHCHMAKTQEHIYWHNYQHLNTSFFMHGDSNILLLNIPNTRTPAN
jgi:hypothetical protein